MLFNSIEFLIFLIVVCSILAIIKYRNFQHMFLLVVSYLFFYLSSNYLLSLLLISTVLDYYVGKEIYYSKTKKRKKLLLIISLAGNLGLLGFFKYADFAITQFNVFGNYINLSDEISLLNLALPIGISFYTFQTISYTVDIYRGQLKPSNSLREFALFVSFFSQLVAGPIVRAKEFLPQLREKFSNNDSIHSRLIQIKSSNLKLGITIIAFGFFKKMFFADNIAPLVNQVFANPVGASSFEIWAATIAFGIQIYGDFSGYSDIAIGTALILGFKIPMNFNKPYFASSPSDFWRRWHISLSSWLRDYFYIPLGGNRKSPSRTYLNLFVVMFFGGLWHGASWNFVIWGVLHGLYLGIHNILKNRFPFLTKIKFFQTKSGKIISILITQYFVFLAWIPFRIHDFDHLSYAIQKYVFIDFVTDNIVQFILLYKIPVALMVLFVILHFISFRKSDLISKISNLPLKYWFMPLAIIMTLIVLFYDGNSKDFIYFRF